MDSCEHLTHAEEQMRDLLRVINDHLKLYEPEEDAYGSLLSVAHHLTEGLREYPRSAARKGDYRFRKSDPGHIPVSRQVRDDLRRLKQMREGRPFNYSVLQAWV